MSEYVPRLLYVKRAWQLFIVGSDDHAHSLAICLRPLPTISPVLSLEETPNVGDVFAMRDALQNMPALG